MAYGHTKTYLVINYNLLITILHPRHDDQKWVMNSTTILSRSETLATALWL